MHCKTNYILFVLVEEGLLLCFGINFYSKCGCCKSNSVTMRECTHVACFIEYVEVAEAKDMVE